MNIKEWKKKKISDFVDYTASQESPNAERLTFIADDETRKQEECIANKTWYSADGDELLNYYTNQEIFGFWRNPIYNRNKRNYFWGLSSNECDIKRVHSGLPRAIITSLTNIIGYPTIKEDSGLWKRIEDENAFQVKLTQQGRPLTMVEGWGAWKINYNTNLADFPLIEYYEAENVDYIVKSGLVIGIIFTTYYTRGNDNYVLFETRYKARGNSYIDYDLFKLMKDNEVEKVPADIIGIDAEQSVIEGLDEILAVPSRYFFDPLNENYGKSIYSGKLDLFDYLDETISIANHTTRDSSPITWISPDFLQRDGLGNVGVPRHWDRTFLTKPGIPDGEGNMNNDVFIDQPKLNIMEYITAAKSIRDDALIGILSPASIGIDLSKRDNAEAQREKEKITIMTKFNIESAETKMIRKLVNLCLMVQEYMKTGVITVADYNVNVEYSELASPSLETKFQTLGVAWINGELSTSKYVDLLWGDLLTNEEKISETEWLDNHRMAGTNYVSENISQVYSQQANESPEVQEQERDAMASESE